MKTIIITGASGNLGQAVVKKFLMEGYRVVGSFLPGEVTHVSFDHENFVKLEIDLADENAAHQGVTDAIAKYGTIDALVATVGGFAMGKINDTSCADIRKQYQLNFETAYNISRPLFNHMMENESGRIFLVGSRPGLNAGSSKGMIAYGLSKSLIFRLAELMNDEAKGHQRRNQCACAQHHRHCCKPCFHEGCGF
jgi:NAD(P)-dependent dehydrogenase (short-subunit alcohol dehydrogenase family)